LPAKEPKREFHVGDKIRVNLHHGKIEDAVVRAVIQDEDGTSNNGPLSYPPDVRHPPCLTFRGSLLPNHQKRNQDGDKRPYKKKLVHKTPSWGIGHTHGSSSVL